MLTKEFYFIFCGLSFLLETELSGSESKEKASSSEKPKRWGEFRVLSSHRDTPNHQPQVNFSLCFLVLIFIISFMKLYINFIWLPLTFCFLVACACWVPNVLCIKSWLCLLKFCSLIGIIGGFSNLVENFDL